MSMSDWLSEAAKLKEQAGLCRSMARTSVLPGAAQGFLDVAANLDEKAAEIERAVRQRAVCTAEPFPPLQLAPAKPQSGSS